MPGPVDDAGLRIDLSWGRGAVSIKMINSEMYGRANPDLLRRLVLLAD